MLVFLLVTVMEYLSKSDNVANVYAFTCSAKKSQSPKNEENTRRCAEQGPVQPADWRKYTELKKK